MPEDRLLLSERTDGPIDVTITNPGSFVQLGVLREGDNQVGVEFYPAADPETRRGFAVTFIGDEAEYGAAIAMKDNKLTIRVPANPGPKRPETGFRLFVPAGSTVNYQSESGKLAFVGNWDPRNDWRMDLEHRPPPIDLTYRAGHGMAVLGGITGTVDAADRDGELNLFLNGGDAYLATSVGKIRATGMGTLSILASEDESSATVIPPCCLNLTVHAGDGKVGLQFANRVAPLTPGTYPWTVIAPSMHSADSRGAGEPDQSLLLTPSSHEAARTASTVLGGPAPSDGDRGRTGQPEAVGDSTQPAANTQAGQSEDSKVGRGRH